MARRYSALILGATGLVGNSLVNRLCLDDRYERLCCLVRAPLQTSDFHDPDNKLQPIVIDFEALQDYQGYFTVDHVYCCLGTTLKEAGSRSAFRRVDFEYVHIAAQLARAQRVAGFVWISSVGANARSSNFYLRVKGELENAIMTMPQLNHAAAIRPSLLDGSRSNLRTAESIAIKILNGLRWLLIGPLRKYRPVPPDQVAIDMIGLQKFDAN